MATTLLFRKQGEQFFNAAGQPLAGGYLYYYIATTTTPQATYYSSSGGTAYNVNPIQLDSSGRLTTPVYFGTAYPYKEVLTDSSSNVISPWPFDNIPQTATPATTSSFALPTFTIQTITSASSPLTLTNAAAGNFYLCNATGGAISIYLPDATTMAAGTGIGFKLISSGANTVTLIPSGVQTIDGAASVPMITYNVPIYIISDGANWRVLISGIYQLLSFTSQNITVSTATPTIDMNVGWVTNVALNVSITTLSFANWPPAGIEGRCIMHLTNSGTNTITWPTATKWSGGTPPVLTASGKDTILITSNDALTTIYGYICAQAQA